MGAGWGWQWQAGLGWAVREVASDTLGLPWMLLFHRMTAGPRPRAADHRGGAAPGSAGPVERPVVGEPAVAVADAAVPRGGGVVRRGGGGDGGEAAQPAGAGPDPGRAGHPGDRHARCGTQRGCRWRGGDRAAACASAQQGIAQRKGAGAQCTPAGQLCVSARAFKMLGADIKAMAMPQSVFSKAKRSETVYTLPLAQGPTEPTVAKVVLARTLSTRHSSLGLSGSSSASQQAGSSLSSSLQISSGPAGS